MIVGRAPGMPDVVRICTSLSLIGALVLAASVASGQAVVSPERLGNSVGAMPSAVSVEWFELRQAPAAADRMVLFVDTRTAMTLSDVREERPKSLTTIAMPLIVSLGLSMLAFLVMAATGGFRTASVQRRRGRWRRRGRGHRL
jgi:hypothetical protein